MLLISYLFSSCILVNKWDKSSRNAGVQTDKVPAPDSATATYDVGVQTGNGTTAVSCNGFSLSQIKEILEDDESNNKKDPGRSLLSEKAQKNIATLRSTHVDLASNLMNLGWNYSSFNDHNQAIKYLEQALAIYHSLDGETADSQLGSILNGLGTAYSEVGDLQKSTSYFKEAKKHEQSPASEDRAC